MDEPAKTRSRFAVIQGGRGGEDPSALVPPQAPSARELVLTGPVIDYLRRNPKGVMEATVVRLCDTADHYRSAVLAGETRERLLRDLVQGLIDGEITRERAAAVLRGL